MTGQPSVGTGELRHQDHADAALERRDLLGILQLLEDPDNLHGAGYATGIVIGGGSGMAEVSNDQDLLLGFARKSGFHHIQISIIDTGLHLAHHLGTGGLGGILLMLGLHLPNESGQLIALTRRQNEAKNVGLS